MSRSSSSSSPSTIRHKSASPTQKQSSENTATEKYWEGEIVKERPARRGKGKEYLVKWKDIDPSTGKPYTPSWEPAKHCTGPLLQEWKEKQASSKPSPSKENRKSTPPKGKRPRQISITSTPANSDKETPQSARRRSSRRSTATPQKDRNQDTETSEYLPSQIVHLPKDSVSPTLRKRTSKKRKSSFGVVIPPFKSSSCASDTNSRKERKEITPEAAKWSSVEPSVEPEQPPKGPKSKKRRLVRKVIEDSQEEQLKSTGTLVQDPIVITSSRSQSEDLPVPSEKSPIPIKAKSPPAPSSQRQSRSRDRTPSQPARNRSLSPVTKVDSWLSIGSDNDFEEAIKDYEQVDMNPNTPLAPGFTPIQTIHRQVTQSNIIQAGTPLPNVSRPMPPRRASSHPLRSTPASVASFSSSLSLRERLQQTHDNAVHEEIRALASYGKKTPSLTSSVGASSILSGGTSQSSLSTTADMTNLKLVPLGEGEQIFAVAGSELQQRMTKGVLVNKQTQIQEFCINPADASDEMVESMKGLMKTCSEIATHPYLIITPPLANAELPEPKEAEYLVASSGKFVALGKILDTLKGDKEIRIGIVVQDAKGMDLLEGFLRGREIRVRRSDGNSMREQQILETRGGPTVTLVMGGTAGARAIVNRVEVVIAMDLSYNPEDDQVLRLRQHPINLDELSPVIRLVTINSAEHVRLCLPTPHEIPSDRIVLQGLVSATTILRNFNGMELSNNDERCSQVAEFIRSNGEKGATVFGIRDIEGYMAGHRGLAGLALKRARPFADEGGGDRKRQQNDELRETLAKKQELNESLRSDLAILQTKFDTLTIQKADLEARVEQTVTENTALRQQIASAPQSDPVFLTGEINRLTKALENKTKDFDYLAARYQDASASASESVAEVAQLKEETEGLRRRLEMDVKAVTWEGERKALRERIQELEDRCKLLEDNLQRAQKSAEEA